MKFKRALFGLASAATVVAPVATIVSCGGGGAATAASIEKSTPVKAKSVWYVADGGSLTDKSFNQNSLEGAQKFVNDHKSEGYTFDKYQPEDGQIKDGYRAAKKAGAEIVVGAGYKHADQADWFTADQHTTFVALDTDLSSMKNPNLGSVIFQSEKAGYLAGLYAVDYINAHTGEFAADGNGHYQVATFGGEMFDTVTSWMDGFVSGVKDGDTAIGASGKQVDVIYTADKPSSSDFTKDMFKSPSTSAQTITNTLISKGADIIFPVAGPQIQDSIKAAGASKVKFIGVDGDQYIALAPNNTSIIGSALKNLKGESENILAAFYASNDKDHANFKAEYIDKAHIGGVGFVYGNDSKDFTQDPSGVANADIKNKMTSYDTYSWVKVFGNLK